MATALFCASVVAQTATEPDLTLRPALRLERGLGAGRPAGEI